MIPLETSELATLLVRLEQALADTAGRFKSQMLAISGLFAVMGIMMGVMVSWGIAAFVWAFGALLAYVGRVAAKKTSPERMRPVYDAVKDAPEKITSVKHYETSDSRRVFVTQWLEIKTAEHRLVMRAADWVQLFEYLQRRCPNAELKR